MGSSHLVQELASVQAHSPETDDGTNRAHLVMITAHQLLEVGKQDFDGLMLSNMADDLFQSVISPHPRLALPFTGRSTPLRQPSLSPLALSRCRQQGYFQHLVHPLHEDELQVPLHLVGDFDHVLLISLRQDDGL